MQRVYWKSNNDKYEMACVRLRVITTERTLDCMLCGCHYKIMATHWNKRLRTSDQILATFLSDKKTIIMERIYTSMKYYPPRRPQDSPPPAGPIDTFMNDDNSMKRQYLVDHFLYIFTWLKKCFNIW